MSRIIAAFFRRFLEIIVGIFWRIPFTKILFQSGLKSHWDALLQLALILTAALAPIFISALIDSMHLVSPSTHASLTFSLYTSQIDKNFQLGELFIYVATFCAPIAWILVKYNRLGRRFDDLYAFFTLGVIIWTLAVVFFVMDRSEHFIAWNSISTIGYSLFAAIIGLTYIAMLYESNLQSFEDFEGTQNRSALNLQARLAKLRH